MSSEINKPADQGVLVKVEGVSKKFCRSLKKSLWYGLCDIGGELNSFRRQVAGVAGTEALRTGDSPKANGPKANELRVTSHNQAAEGGSNQLVTRHPSHVTLPAAAARDEDLRDGEFYAVRDVSFELRRGECLGLIGHNGAGTQAANVAARMTAVGSPEGEMPLARINTTLLKMLNGLIKPDAGRITMRGRVAKWHMQKTPQANGAGQLANYLMSR